MRNVHLDALRGYCLVVMMIDHLRFQGLLRFTYGSYGFFDAADGFVFISALVAASYYSRLSENRGWRAATGRALRRARLIYLTHVLLEAGWIVGVMFAASFVHLLNDPPHPHPGLAYLVRASLWLDESYYDILPLYAVMMLLVPLMLRFCRGRGMGWMIGFSGAIWLLCQPGTAASRWLPALHLWAPICIPCWQFLFVLGFVLGCVQSRDGMPKWLESRWAWWFLVPVVGFLFILRHPLVTLPGAGTMVQKYLHTQCWWTAKNSLGPLRILDFGLFALLLASLTRAFGSRVQASLVHQWLRFLGQHSLQVYAWSIPVDRSTWFAVSHFRVLRSGTAHVALAFLAVAALIVPAYIHAIYRRRRASLATPFVGSNASRTTGFGVDDLAVARFHKEP